MTQSIINKNGIALHFLGWDSWDRPVYSYGKENLIVDTNPVGENPSLYTKSSNDFDGEPDIPFRKPVFFCPERKVWML